MSKRDSYAVRISGLGEGDHDFSFELDQKFFALFEQSEIENGNVQAEVILEKKMDCWNSIFSWKVKWRWFVTVAWNLF